MFVAGKKRSFSGILPDLKRTELEVIWNRGLLKCLFEVDQTVAQCEVGCLDAIAHLQGEVELAETIGNGLGCDLELLADLGVVVAKRNIAEKYVFVWRELNVAWGTMGCAG